MIKKNPFINTSFYLIIVITGFYLSKNIYTFIFRKQQITSMPYTKILIHAVWSTKNRLPLLTVDIRSKVFQHISENAKSKGIDLVIINGFVDHCHCIINLNSNQNMATVMNLLKGEVSYWINRQKLSPTKFEWQDEYFAVSFSLSQLEIVKSYILNQEAHHTKKTYQQEYDDFVAKFGFEQ